MDPLKTLAPAATVPFSSRPVALDLCAGPGGWDEGARIHGLEDHIVGVELNAIAATTAQAAGHTRLLGDITAIDPRDWAHVEGLVSSTPCPTFSTGGKRSGTGVDYQTVLDVITHLGSHDCDGSWEEIQDELGTITDPRTALAAQPARLELSPAMESLEWLVLEQVPAAESMFEDFAAEPFSADGAAWCLTGSARSWTRVSDGGQLTVPEASVLQGFRGDYPWTGSRSAAFKQVADVVLSPAATAVLAGAQGMAGEEQMGSCLDGLYDRSVATVAA